MATMVYEFQHRAKRLAGIWPYRYIGINFDVDGEVEHEAPPDNYTGSPGKTSQYKKDMERDGRDAFDCIIHLVTDDVNEAKDLEHALTFGADGTDDRYNLNTAPDRTGKVDHVGAGKRGGRKGYDRNIAKNPNHMREMSQKQKRDGTHKKFTKEECRKGSKKANESGATSAGWFTEETARERGKLGNDKLRVEVEVDNKKFESLSEMERQTGQCRKKVRNAMRPDVYEPFPVLKNGRWIKPLACGDKVYDGVRQANRETGIPVNNIILWSKKGENGWRYLQEGEFESE